MNKFLVSLVVVLGFAAPAAAQEFDNWYVGVSAVDTSISTATFEIDDSGYSLTLGYSFDAIEGFETSAELSYNELVTIDLGGGNIRSDLGLNSTDLSALIGKQFDGVTPFFRFGYTHGAGDVYVADGTTASSASNSGNGYIFGLGLDIAVSQKSGVRFEYSQSDFDGDELDALRVGLIGRF